MHGAGADLRRDVRDDPGWCPAADQQRSVRGVAQCGDARQVAGRGGAVRVCKQDRVEHDERQHLVGAVQRTDQRWVIGQPQVTTEPDDGSAHRPSTAPPLGDKI